MDKERSLRNDPTDCNALRSMNMINLPEVSGSSDQVVHGPHTGDIHTLEALLLSVFAFGYGTMGMEDSPMVLSYLPRHWISEFEAGNRIHVSPLQRTKFLHH